MPPAARRLPPPCPLSGGNDSLRTPSGRRRGFRSANAARKPRLRSKSVRFPSSGKGKPQKTTSSNIQPERTPAAQPPHQPKVLEEEREGFGEGEGKLSSESFPSPSPIFRPYIPAAFFRAATSAGLSSRTSPGRMTPRRKGPCATRTRRRIVRPRSRHIRRIWRFSP